MSQVATLTRTASSSGTITARAFDASGVAYAVATSVSGTHPNFWVARSALGLGDADSGYVEWYDDGTLIVRAAIGADLATVDANVGTLIAQLTQAYGEPADAPGVSETLPEKVGYLYSALRNQIDVTASAKTFYDDSGSALWSKVLSDDGNTYSEAEGS